MKLYNAARVGDTTVAADAYSLDTFMCQFEVLSYSKIDGVAVKKRTISTAPDVVIPARSVVVINGQHYLIGHPAPDFWKDEVIRLNYVIQGSDGLAELNTIAGALADSAPVQAYAALVFSKYLPDSDDSSKYPPQYQVFLAGTESAPADSLIKLNDVWYMVKESYRSNSGLRVALSNVVAEPNFETVTFKTVTYDPLTDTESTSTSTVKILRVKWSEHYKYLSIGSTQYERGDQQVFLLKATTPKPSDTITLSDGEWRVISTQDEGLVWSCHVRRT